MFASFPSRKERIPSATISTSTRPRCAPSRKGTRTLTCKSPELPNADSHRLGSKTVPAGPDSERIREGRCGGGAARGCDALVATCFCGAPAAESPFKRRPARRGGADTRCDGASQPRLRRHAACTIESSHVRTAGAAHPWARIQSHPIAGMISRLLLLLAVFTFCATQAVPAAESKATVSASQQIDALLAA